MGRTKGSLGKKTIARLEAEKAKVQPVQEEPKVETQCEEVKALPTA